MMLELELTGGVNALVALPVVLHRDVLDDELLVQEAGDFVADHEDLKAVPLSGRMVCLLEGILGVLLVVIEPARSLRTVPELHLRASTQIDAAVVAGIDLPVDPHL